MGEIKFCVKFGVQFDPMAHSISQQTITYKGGVVGMA